AALGPVFERWDQRTQANGTARYFGAGNVMRFLRSSLDLTARYRLAAIACAIERYRLDNGAEPESLDALVPAYLDSLPPDPYNGEAPAYTCEGPAVYNVSYRGTGVNAPSGVNKDGDVREPQYDDI